MTAKNLKDRLSNAGYPTGQRTRKIEYISPSLLKPNPRNARVHSQEQIIHVAASIRKFGFTNPILVDAHYGIIAGHARYDAAKELGLEAIPVVRIEHLTPAEIRAYMIADNRLAELAGWDKDILAVELQELSALDLDFDIEITGFSVPEIDNVIETAAESAIAATPLDTIPQLPPHAVTQLGDIWIIGPHRLICGDATRSEPYAALLGEEKAQLIFIDPPYNVPIDGHVSGLGETRHREFAMAAGEMNEEQFATFLRNALTHHAAYSVDGALHFVCMDWRHQGELLEAGRHVYDELKNLCVWVKTNGGMGSLYRSQHELVFVFKKGREPHINNIQLGKYGRYRTNVWTYAGANSFGPTREQDLSAHPTVKPVQMVADAILDASHPGDIILDGFAGSGTTLIAAHKVRRRGFGIELDPLYCDVILKRLAAATGSDPVHQESRLTFDDLATQRLTHSDEEEAGDE